LVVNLVTQVLKDFRKYRPANHNQWLAYVQRRAREVGVRSFAIDGGCSAACRKIVKHVLVIWAHGVWTEGGCSAFRPQQHGPLLGQPGPRPRVPSEALVLHSRIHVSTVHGR
jgi:hypothetical protein